MGFFTCCSHEASHIWFRRLGLKHTYNTDQFYDAFFQFLSFASKLSILKKLAKSYRFETWEWVNDQI